MPYTADRGRPATSSDELRARIPGWGADLDPQVRPSVPSQRFDPSSTGAHWTFPDRQPEMTPRERSVEHEFLPPVFGTSAPLTGLSGIIRRHAYRRYSEGRSAHWLMLIAADRVDAVENHARSLLTRHPDNPITETGVLSEVRRHGISSRFGKHRADLHHTWMDPIIVGGPWVLAGGTVYLAARRLRRRVG
jgi:hypothetical protein